MTSEEFQGACDRTSAFKDTASLTNPVIPPEHWQGRKLAAATLALSSASGDVAEYCKKVLVHGKPFDPKAFEALQWGVQDAVNRMPEAVKEYGGPLAAPPAPPSVLHAVYSVLGLCGEAGEVAAKWSGALAGIALVQADVAEEAGDAAFYLSDICTAHGLSLGTVMADNVKKLKDRYPDGFKARYAEGS